MIRHLGERFPAELIRRSRLLACMAALALLLVSLSCTTSPTESQAGSKGAPEVVEIPTGNFTAQWRAEIPLRQTQPRSIHLNEDKVLLYTSDNKCIWVNRASGHIVSIVQAAKTTDTLYPPVTLADRVVFPSTSELSVFSRNGKLMHKIGLRYNESSGASGDGRRVYFGMDHPNGGRVVAMDTRPQPYEVSPEWELMTRGQVSAAPAVYQELVFAGSRDGGVYAMRGENRANIWPGLEIGFFKTGGEILADLQADKDGVYVASMDSKVYCLDINTGRVKWTYYAGRPLRHDSSPIAAANFVYTYVPTAGIVAIEKAGQQEVRSPKWTASKGRQLLASDEKYAYIRGADYSIMAVDKQSGDSKFASRRNDFRVFGTNIGGKDNNIYACTPGGMLYCISAVLKPGTVGEWVESDVPTSAEAVAAK
jgi:outer membrane protein assembly factor BamB